MILNYPIIKTNHANCGGEIEHIEGLEETIERCQKCGLQDVYLYE